jgi:hypothetical protein
MNELEYASAFKKIEKGRIYSFKDYGFSIWFPRDPEFQRGKCDSGADKAEDVVYATQDGCISYYIHIQKYKRGSPRSLDVEGRLNVARKVLRAVMPAPITIIADASFEHQGYPGRTVVARCAKCFFWTNTYVVDNTDYSQNACVFAAEVPDEVTDIYFKTFRILT